MVARVRTQDAEAILNIAKRLVRENRRFDKLSETELSQTIANSTQKRRDSIRNDLNYQAHELDVVSSELHAACVNGGIAKILPREEYETMAWQPDGWHDYKWTPAKPKALSEVA